MPLYLGFDIGTTALTAIVIEIEKDTRRVVFNRSLQFDRDFPDYSVTDDAPLMWADALDRMLARLAAAAEVEIERLRAIAGAIHERDIDLPRAAGDAWRAITPSAGVPVVWVSPWRGAMRSWSASL